MTTATYSVTTGAPQDIPSGTDLAAIFASFDPVDGKTVIPTTRIFTNFFNVMYNKVMF